MPLNPAFSLLLPLAQLLAWRLWASWLKKGAGKLLIACLYLAVNALAVSVVFNWYWTAEPPPTNPVAWSWFYRPILLWELAHLAWLAICVLIFAASLPMKYWAKKKAKGLPSLFKAKSEAPPLMALRLSILALLLAGAFFGYIRQLAPPRLVLFEVAAQGLPKELDGLTIAFLSDLRYGRGANLSDLASLFESLKLYQPDVLIMYGPIVEKSPVLASDLGPLVAGLAPSRGAYAVLSPSGFSEEELSQAFKSAGVETLSNSRLSLPNLPLALVGFSGGPLTRERAAAPSEEPPEDLSAASGAPSDFDLLSGPPVPQGRLSLAVDRRPRPPEDFEGRDVLVFATSTPEGDLLLPFVPDSLEELYGPASASGLRQAGGTVVLVSDPLSGYLPIRLGEVPKITIISLKAS